MVGNFVGKEAVAAVGSCGALTFFFINLSSGLAIGIGVIVSQYFGAKDYASVKKTVASSFYVLTAASIIVTIVATVFAPGIMKFLKVPDEIRSDSVLYLRLTCGAGDTGFSMINGICEVVVRISFAIFLTHTALGYWGVWWTNCITWTFTGIVCLLRYWSGVWKKKNVV
ncbi:MAG: hypothetical protein MJ162_06560 [Treponema sp.]|nr:hypothetical protein [Treponema sp.]